MKTDHVGRDPDAAITARAREIARELFDEDIVKMELEFDEPSFNLFAGIIAAALCAVRDETLSQVEPYLQHEPDCETAVVGMRVGADCLWWRVGDEIVTRSSMDTFDKETRRPVICTCGLAALRAGGGGAG